MDVSEAVERLHTAQTAAGLGRIAGPNEEVEHSLTRLAAALAPLQLPADLVTFWRMVDPATLDVAPCPRPVGPKVSLQLWERHLAGDEALRGFLPWCHESSDFMVIELGRPDAPDPRENGCYSWAGGRSPLVRTFCSVTAYLDLMAAMLEVHPVDRVPDGLTTVSALRAAAPDELCSVQRATRRGDLRTAVRLAAPLYDRLFRTPAAGPARTIRTGG